VTALADKTDACNPNTHCTGKKIGNPVHIGLPYPPSEVSENAIARNLPETSEDVVTKALALFGGKIVAIIPPDAAVPGRFRDVLADWRPTRNHPGLEGYTPRRLIGWTKRGSPVYASNRP
jgi:hypothetical protein